MSGRKVYFRCERGHVLPSMVAHRVRGSRCKTCYLEDASENRHRILDDFPEAQNMTDVDLSDISITSTEKITLIHPLTGHSETHQSLKFYSMLKEGWHTTVPDTWVEFPDKDTIPGEMYPSYIAPSARKVTYRMRCGKGHEYDATAFNLSRGRFCPYCEHRELLTGFNDVNTIIPDASSWINDDATTTVYVPSRRVSWTCPDCDHEFIRDMSLMENPVCPRCGDDTRIVTTGINDVSTSFPWLEEWWNDDREPSKVFHGTRSYFRFKCPTKGHEFEKRIDSIRYQGAMSCSVCSSSQGEKELREIIESWGVRVENNTRDIISPYEIDIYLPDHHIGIEYNGIYYHSEKMIPDHNYHHRKWSMARDQGIQLITIWEDEWRDKKGIVTSMIRSKIGHDSTPRMYARKLNVKEISHDQADELCRQYHIQSGASGTVYHGLADNKDNVIAASVWRKEGTTLTLSRYCSSVPVTGGMSKLISAGKRWGRDNDCDRIITFSDNCVSDGTSYEKIGFVNDGKIYPDYKYLYRGDRYHKFGFRKNRFITDNALFYDDTMTEHELALANGIYRVWDCGKIRWSMRI